jgi:pimeloyl-ACP methyl ester carboxylesterase
MFDGTIENVQPLAVCLHASASSQRQWLQLEAELEPHIRTISPALIGYGAVPFTQGNRLHINDEVDNVIRQVELMTGKNNGPLHLIGHSYGGAVALQLALRYPGRVASLTLYEPAQFLMLFADGLKSEAAREIRNVALRVANRTGTPWGRRKAARIFIDYWSGTGAWNSIPNKRRRRIAGLVPKVAAEFRAIVSAQVSATDFAELNIPVRLIHGSQTRQTARQVTEALADTLPTVECVELEGMSHMAPCTHPDRINPILKEHVLARLAGTPRSAVGGATIRPLRLLTGH